MKKRKKKKPNNKMKIFMYCRVGTPEQIVTQDRKKETFIVQKDKKSIDKLAILGLHIDYSDHLWYNYS